MTSTGLSNTPPPWVKDNLMLLAGALEIVRGVLKHPMKINSGYRSPDVNRAVGGSLTSRHMEGLAADFVCPEFGSPLDVCRELVKAGVLYDQIIYEHTWTHYGLPRIGEAPRSEVLTLIGPGKYAKGIVEK